MKQTVQRKKCPYCKTPVVATTDARHVNGIKPQDRRVRGCEFCRPK